MDRAGRPTSDDALIHRVIVVTLPPDSHMQHLHQTEHTKKKKKQKETEPIRIHSAAYDYKTRNKQTNKQTNNKKNFVQGMTWFIESRNHWAVISPVIMNASGAVGDSVYDETVVSNVFGKQFEKSVAKSGSIMRDV
jgi:hypothetical protein